MNAEFAAAFALDDGLVYLNHAGVAPWPVCARDAAIAFARENAASGAANYPRWIAVEQRLRDRLAQLIGAAGADDIALVPNTSAGLSIIAGGLDWRAGDNIVSFAGEFPSNRIVWQALAEQGVELRLVSLSGDDPEHELLSACDRNTRLIAVSAVQFHNGFRIDLERIGAETQRRGILFCVDAIQWVGALRMDVGALNIDFLAADGHKWMLGPEGIGVLWMRPELRERLTLHAHGWHMVERAEDFSATAWQPAKTARRFEPGSPNLLGIHALDAAVGLLLDTGLARVEQRVLDNTRAIMEHVQATSSLRLMSRAQAERRSGSVTFAAEGASDHDVLRRHLAAAGVVGAARGGGLRFSPHFYQDWSDIERAFAALSQARR